MANKAKKGLGRGLSALLGDDVAAPQTVARPQAPAGLTAPLSRLEPNPDQPRKDFSEEALEELASSIREKGVLQPILVRTSPRDPDLYEIVAGERRWRAAQRAQRHEVPIVLRELDDREALEVAIIENVQRTDLNPVEEAEGYGRLMESFSYTQEQLAQTVARSRSHIANMLRLMKLPTSVLQMLRDGILTAGHARALIGHPKAEELARVIAAKGLSVRETEKLTAATNAAAPSRPAKTRKDPDTLALEADLTANLGAPVKIADKGGKGTLTIEYKTLDQLDSLIERIGMMQGNP